MPAICFPGSPDTRKFVLLTVLAAGMFAVLSGLSSAVFAEVIRQNSIMYWAGLVVILIAVIAILYAFFKIRKEVF